MHDAGYSREHLLATYDEIIYLLARVDEAFEDTEDMHTVLLADTLDTQIADARGACSLAASAIVSARDDENGAEVVSLR